MATGAISENDSVNKLRHLHDKYSYNCWQRGASMDVGSCIYGVSTTTQQDGKTFIAGGRAHTLSKYTRDRS